MINVGGLIEHLTENALPNLEDCFGNVKEILSILKPMSNGKQVSVVIFVVDRRKYSELFRNYSNKKYCEIFLKLAV
jgi:hypothetical protein